MIYVEWYSHKLATINKCNRNATLKILWIFKNQWNTHFWITCHPLGSLRTPSRRSFCQKFTVSVIKKCLDIDYLPTKYLHRDDANYVGLGAKPSLQITSSVHPPVYLYVQYMVVDSFRWQINHKPFTGHPDDPTDGHIIYLDFFSGEVRS